MSENNTVEQLSPSGENAHHLVELEHVEKYYGNLHVLRDINLKVDKGEVLVIVGPSGSGKSTMCRTINRLETIDSGVIRIDGQALPQEGKGLAQLRAEVGMVFQSFNLFANKTILENVTLAPIKVRHMNRDQAEKEAMDTACASRRRFAGHEDAVAAIGWTTAARGHRALAGHASEGHAVRRADLGARP